MTVPAMAEETTLLLEFVVNGRLTGMIGEFTSVEGALSATATELAELGLKVPEKLARSGKPIPLSALPGLKFTVNEADQRLLVSAPDAALRPYEIGTPSPPPLQMLNRAGFGAVLNYDLLNTQVTNGGNSGGTFDARLSSPYGVLSNNGIGSYGAGATTTFRRLDTTYVYTDSDGMRCWRAGDVITGALSWTRATRLGGAQLASDFSLQPNLVTYPVPMLTSSAAVPSTVNVLVNGIREYSQPVQPGPFQVRTIPVVNGFGEMAVTVQDALGRRVLVNLPFYIAPQTLRQGFASYSVEVGTVRQSYGLPTDSYRNAAGSASLRYGLLDWLTPEAHAEFTSGVHLAGLGAAVRVGTLGC